MIAVAGGTGRLGQELVAALGQRAEPLRVLTRHPEAVPARLPGGTEVVSADVRDPAGLRAALRGSEVVVSAITGFGVGGLGTRAVDEEGNANLIQAAEAEGVRRLVLVSMHGAASDHPMELLRRKHAAEQRLRSSRLEWVIVRPTPSADLWVELVGAPIAEGKTTVVFGSGDNPINWVAQRDVAGVLVEAVTDASLAGEVVPVGGPDNVSLNEMAGRIAAFLNRPAGARRIPVPVLRLGRLALRPVRQDLAGMVEGGLCLATQDMRFDATELTIRFPALRLTPLDELIAERFGARPALSKAG